MNDVAQQDNLIDLASDIVSAYVSNNSLNSADLPGLINSVYTALRHSAERTTEPEPEPREPAVSIRKSVTAEAIICLEDGKRYKSLKRHLRTNHDLTPQEYRDKWGLRPDYPMVAPNYAQARSKLAKKMGLGRKSSS